MNRSMEQKKIKLECKQRATAIWSVVVTVFQITGDRMDYLLNDMEQLENKVGAPSHNLQENKSPMHQLLKHKE